VLPPSPPYPYILFFHSPPVPSQGRCPPTFSPSRVAHLAGADAHQSPGRGFESRTGDHFSELELGNNKETRRLPVSFHLEGVVSFAGARSRWNCACAFLVEMNQIVFLSSSFGFVCLLSCASFLNIIARPSIRCSLFLGPAVAFSFSDLVSLGRIVASSSLLAHRFRKRIAYW
jgi:hypothetical protein